MEELQEKRQLSATPLLLAVGIIAICGIIYELIIGAISSYLLGNSVKQYSITIGLFMSAMGVGSYLTRYIKKDLFDTFILVELTIGLAGGLSAILLFTAYGYTDFYHLVMYITIILIGVLVGIEIPLLTRIIEGNENNLRMTIANVLSVDYIGALFGSLAFPLILLPNLGEIRTSFFVGMLNILVALLILMYYKDYIKRNKTLMALASVMLVVVLSGVIVGDQIGLKIEDRLYRDKIIYNEQTKYQKMILTQHKDDIRLYLDGNIQFSSLDEHRYHEALVHPAMELSDQREKILILGGGDGLAARELLKYDDVEEITIVDLDPGVTELARTNNLIVGLNKDSLNNEKVKVINGDAFQFLESANTLYNVIIVDLPDPNNESLNKLYTNVFYRLIGNKLDSGGVFVVQSTSPYYAKEAYWSIRKTVASEGFFTDGYHVNIPSFGDWGFTLASNSPLGEKTFDFEVPLKFLNEKTALSMFNFAEDEVLDLDQVEINSLTHPVLIRYYEAAWQNM
ncbi:polyamine aminopropyltransferase [Fusibacter sp. JL216-2]|uniref:polyamine aminopropyltransferase n=1 Tax=Fusibacter sp. JL216-2 TaxID=3071453 RepID=UPI003D32486F